MLFRSGAPAAFFNVTVIVEVVEPSAFTDAGLAATVDWPASANGVNVTVAV